VLLQAALTGTVDTHDPHRFARTGDREWSKVGGIFHDPSDHAHILDRADVQ
jgi:hypothetical protein